jgi:hypothetical protein
MVIRTPNSNKSGVKVNANSNCDRSAWFARGSGTVISVGKHQDYRVKLHSGRVYWRNRRFLKPDYSADAEPRRPPVCIDPTPKEIEIPDHLNENREQSSHRRQKQLNNVLPQRRSERIRKKNPRYFD